MSDKFMTRTIEQCNSDKKPRASKFAALLLIDKIKYAFGSLELSSKIGPIHFHNWLVAELDFISEIDPDASYLPSLRNLQYTLTPDGFAKFSSQLGIKGRNDAELGVLTKALFDLIESNKN